MYKWIIYKTTCLINDKIYIGQHKTKDINDSYLGSGKLIKRAIGKYGINNFRRDILEIAECRSTASALEEAYISKFNSTDTEIGYNISKLAWGGQPHTPESKAKISKTLTGIKRTEEFKNNLRKPKPKRSKDHSEKISKAHKGKVWYNNPDTGESKQFRPDDIIPSKWIVGRGKTQKIGEDRKKKTYSEAGRQSIITSARNPLKRKQISETLSGHLVSDETRLKISKSLRKYYEENGNNSDNR